MTLTLIIGNKNYSSWSLRPWLAMKQFNLAFDEIRIPLYCSDSTEKIRRYCPKGSGKVPILLHDDRPIWDSIAIFEYLSETFSDRAWWPADLRARSWARSICAEMHSGFFAVRNSMPMNCRADLPGKGMSPDVQQDIDRITSVWRGCRQQVDQGNFLFGDFTIADAMFAPVVLRFRTYGVQLDSNCRTYADAILALPAIQSWLQAAQTEAETIPEFEL